MLKIALCAGAIYNSSSIFKMPRILLMFAICGFGYNIYAISTLDLVCPESTSNGTWEVASDLCKLQCIQGYRPTGCRLLRQSVGWRWLFSKWNHPIPECKPVSWLDRIPFSRIDVVMVLLLGFFVLPAALAWLGFGAGGIKPRSLAASRQTPFTAPGSLFAFLQSAGMVGLPILIKLVMGLVGTFLLNKIMLMFSVYTYGECK